MEKKLVSAGIFVRGKLIGIDGIICRDSDVGKKFCNSENEEFIVVGCTIPNMLGKEKSSDVIVLD